MVVNQGSDHHSSPDWWHDWGLPEPWEQSAACRGMDSTIFFGAPPDAEWRSMRRTWQQTKLAKAVCARCTVRAECLAWSVRVRIPHGIFGGLSHHERKRLWQPEGNDKTVN
jgi:WhiB family redox-sensing transcriptional regulator